MNNRDISLDLLRSLCILYIVGFWHLFNYTDAFPQYYNIITLRVTWTVLASFTLLSGYFVGIKNENFDKKNTWKFFKKRVLRIYPLYATALLLFFLFGLADLSTVMKASIAVSMFSKPAPPTLWYITMLLVFYTISPILLKSIQSKKIAAAAAGYVLLSFTLLIVHYFLRNIDLRVLVYLPSFYLGILLSTEKIIVPGKALVLLLVAGLFFSFILNQNNLAVDGLLATPLVTVGAYCIFVSFKKIPLKNPFYSAVSTLAYSSYCMYLFHRPLYITLKKIYFPGSGMAQTGYLIFFCLPCVIILSMYIQKYNDSIIRFFQGVFPTHNPV